MWHWPRVKLLQAQLHSGRQAQATSPPAVGPACCWGVLNRLSGLTHSSPLNCCRAPVPGQSGRLRQPLCCLATTGCDLSLSAALQGCCNARASWQSAGMAGPKLQTVIPPANERTDVDGATHFVSGRPCDHSVLVDDPVTLGFLSHARSPSTCTHLALAAVDGPVMHSRCQADISKAQSTAVQAPCTMASWLTGRSRQSWRPAPTPCPCPQPAPSPTGLRSMREPTRAPPRGTPSPATAPQRPAPPCSIAAG